jgi:hypothetical protein
MMMLVSDVNYVLDDLAGSLIAVVEVVDVLDDVAG